MQVEREELLRRHFLVVVHTAGSSLVLSKARLYGLCFGSFPGLLIAHKIVPDFLIAHKIAPLALNVTVIARGI